MLSAVGVIYLFTPWWFITYLVDSDAAVWLQDPLPYFASIPQADILASSDAVAPSHDDGGLEDAQQMGSYELNIGTNPLPITDLCLLL